MDDIVRQAMAKWPNVPDCYGWLGLDIRGNWYMRDERAQRCGAFHSGQPGAKGAELKHEKLRAFIERNYGCDAHGCWYFQNGPQRVYVELEGAPWVWRLQPSGTVCSHTGIAVQVQHAVLDDLGRLYLMSDLGLGIVHAQDMWDASERLSRGEWALHETSAQDLPGRYGYNRSPEATLPTTK